MAASNVLHLSSSSALVHATGRRQKNKCSCVYLPLGNLTGADLTWGTVSIMIRIDPAYCVLCGSDSSVEWGAQGPWRKGEVIIIMGEVWEGVAQRRWAYLQKASEG